MANYVFGNNSKIALHLIDAQTDRLITIGRTGNFDHYCDLLTLDEFDFGIFSNVDRVVFCAAISSPNDCVQQLELSTAVNVIGTFNAIKKILETGAKVLFLSSDVVFEGSSGPVNENSTRHPQNIYAFQKSIIEKSFEDYDGFLNYRLSYVFGEHDPFYNYLLRCMRNREEVEVFDEYRRSIVFVNDVLHAINLFFKNEFIPRPNLHLCGNHAVSKLDMAQTFSEYFDLKYRAVPAPKHFFKHRAKKIELQSLFFSELLGRDPITFDEFVKNIKI